MAVAFGDSIRKLKGGGLRPGGACPEDTVLIQFACPSCKSGCGVDDRFAGRKFKCPKCGARVLHFRDSHVELLTPGTVPLAGAAAAAAAPPPSAAPAAAPSPGSSGGDPTPLATAVVPHSVGDFVKQDESKQNRMIVGGLLTLFLAVLSILGLALDIKLLVVAPIAAGLSIAAVWLWLRKRRLEEKYISTKIDAKKR